MLLGLFAIITYLGRVCISVSGLCEQKGGLDCRDDHSD